MSRDSTEQIVEQRRERGVGQLDECWEGVWHLTDPAYKHQDVAGCFYRIHAEVLRDTGRAMVLISINVTDREED